MSEEQTGGEQATAEPKEVEAEEAKVKPAHSETDSDKLSDEDVLEKLAIKPHESRKTRAIKRSAKAYNKVLDEDGYIDFDELAVEVDKNPKGLATFAAVNNFDLEELQKELAAEQEIHKPEIEKRLEELEERLAARNNEASADEYTAKIKELVTNSNMTLSDFYANSGEDFNIYVQGLQAQGHTAVEAAELAFKRVHPNTDSKAELLDAAKEMPKGNTVAHTKELVPMSREEVNALDDEARLAYKRKFRTADGIQYR